MKPTVTPIDATFGARITGVALANLNDDAWNEIEDAFHEYGMLVFPNQGLSEEDQVDFALRFGEIEHLRANKDQKAVKITNKKADGSVLQPDEHRFKALRGNEGWHTDSSYMPLAAKASILSAIVVPKSGGGTACADMRAAYDALDDEMKERIEDLSAHHSLYQSQSKIGHIVETGTAYGYHNKGAPLRPLVKTHPVTGRKSLFIGRHAYGIPGLGEEESEQLLNDLLDFACQAPRTYYHAWQPGDAVMWDNRCILHAAQPYDYGETRIMQHTRIAGDPASELVATARDERAAGFEPSASNM